MKITRIDTFKVSVPYTPGIRKYMPTEHTTGLLIKMYTDEGIVGFGEGGGDLSSVIPEWIGKDPMKMDLFATSPFVTALFDIVGKALGVPAWRLMGDRCREKVPVSYWSCYMDPEDTGKEAEFAAKRGFKNHKLKARPWDIVQQAEIITRVAGPEYSITVDPNRMFKDVSGTVKIARQLEPYNILCFEDPIKAKNWPMYALMRQKIDIPVASHLNNKCPEDVLDAVKAEAVDIFNILGENLGKVLCSCAIAEAACIPIWLSVGGLCLGAGGAFAVHVGAVVKNATLPADTLHFLREDYLLKDHPIDPKDGFIDVPEGPGLGVELDEKSIEKYRIG